MQTIAYRGPTADELFDIEQRARALRAAHLAAFFRGIRRWLAGHAPAAGRAARA